VRGQIGLRNLSSRSTAGCLLSGGERREKEGAGVKDPAATNLTNVASGLRKAKEKGSGVHNGTRSKLSGAG